MPTLTKQIIEQYLSDPHNVRLQKWRFSTQFTSGFTAIDVDAAEAMTKHKGSLELQGLTSLSEGAARALSRRKGELNLNGLTSLSEGVARALSQHKGRLHLFRLTSLSDGAAEALARHEGHIHFFELKEISDHGLLSMAKCLRQIHWDARFTKRLKRLMTPLGGEEKAVPPQEWLDGRVVLQPPMEGATWQTQSYLSKHKDIPTSLFKWFTSLLPNGHLREIDYGYFRTQEMTEAAAYLLVEHRGFFEAVRSSKSRESSRQREEQMQVLGDVAIEVGLSKADLEQKHKRLVELALAANLDLVADMLSAGEGWFCASLLIGTRISADGTLALGEPLRRVGRTFAKAKELDGAVQSQHLAKGFVEAVGALALRYAPEGALEKMDLRLSQLKKLTVLEQTLGALAEHVFCLLPRLIPDVKSLRGLEQLSAAGAEVIARHKGYLDLPSLTCLSDAAAESLAQHQGKLRLDGLTSLSDAAAKALAQHQGELSLNGLTSLSEGAAQALSHHKGDLWLQRLTSLSDAVAEALAKHQGDLFFYDLASLSDAAAEALSQHKGRLILNGLTSISNAAAKSLAQHQGELGLRGLTSLSDAAAEALAQYPGELWLDGLTSLSDAAAEALAQHQGELRLNGLKTLSEGAAQALREHKGPLYVSDKASPALERLRRRITGARLFEYEGDGSSKFWDIRLCGAEIAIRFGRIGTTGQEKVKTFPNAVAAAKEQSKQIREKLGKGYQEV
jgi:predicted DNA-binding WGR domain protein